jgi:hypothetical protein
MKLLMFPRCIFLVVAQTLGLDNPGNAADDTSSPNPGGSVGYNYEFARTKSAAALPQPKKFSIQLGRANEIISADGIIEQLRVTSGFVKSVSNTS